MTINLNISCVFSAITVIMFKALLLFATSYTATLFSGIEVA